MIILNELKNDNGEKFENSKQRGKYIRRYYEKLYKKKLDRLLEIEDFLEGGGHMVN